MSNNSTRNMVIAAVCLALCMVLPFLTGQIPEIGSALSPMHIPVFLCGFAAGWPYALVVGLIAPVLRFALFGMPPLFPVGAAMAFELATYGIVSGLLYRALPRRKTSIYVTLVISMLAGRVVWGVARLALAGLSNTTFGWAAFLAGAFTQAVPGIICHILLIPVIVIALEMAKLISRK